LVAAITAKAEAEKVTVTQHGSFEAYSAEASNTVSETRQFF
jgi:hypothetical protein